MSIAKELEAVLQGRDEVTLRGAYGVELFAKRLKNDELTLSMRGANGWELVAMIGGVCEYSRVLFGCVAETIAETLRNAAPSPPACEAVNVPATSQNVAQAAIAPRCGHLKSIKRVFAVARDVGLDTRADAAMRASFSRFLGRAIESRAALKPADWSMIGTAIKSQELTW